MAPWGVFVRMKIDQLRKANVREKEKKIVFLDKYEEKATKSVDKRKVRRYNQTNILRVFEIV